MRAIKQKTAMSTFEMIGYAILAIVVILVAIVIFVKLTKGPSDSIDKITGGSQSSIDACIKDPTKCTGATTKTAAPKIISYIQPSVLQIKTAY